MWDELDEIEGKLDEIDTCGDLNDWEIEFVDSMLKKTDKGYIPTQKEMVKINELWHKYV